MTSPKLKQYGKQLSLAKANVLKRVRQANDYDISDCRSKLYEEIVGLLSEQDSDVHDIIRSAFVSSVENDS